MSRRGYVIRHVAREDRARAKYAYNHDYNYDYLLDAPKKKKPPMSRGKYLTILALVVLYAVIAGLVAG